MGNATPLRRLFDDGVILMDRMELRGWSLSIHGPVSGAEHL